MIDRAHPLPVNRQAELLDVSRGSVYYEPVPTSEADLALMAAMDEIHLALPFYGISRIRDELRDRGFTVGRGHVATLMRKMGMQARYPKRRLSKPHPGHTVYPYLLRGLDITRAGQVWCADITYLPMAARLLLPYGGHGLGEPTRTQLATLEHPGRLLLHRGARRGPATLRGPEDLQHRSRCPVHFGGIHRPP
ncbi:MAG: IS3 family transposase [Actinobacteria bacterium]|nr:IS3 family transposase [Actinomycetota bacterium]